MPTLLLCSALVVAAARAAEPATPSVDLLLYLAEWQTDAEGRLVDPLDLPDSDPPPPDTRPAEPSPPTASKPEYPR